MDREKDKGIVGEILHPYLPTLQGESWEETLANDENIFLREDDNLAIFELSQPKVYLGHYFFNSARGRKAIELSKKALNIIFDQAEVVEGWTPLDNKPALLMSKWLGFKSYGQIDTMAGPMELFIMTKNEWRLRNE